MAIKESGENYLETIFVLQKKNGFVRSIDIATELDYSKASISRAMSILKEDGYISIDHSGQIILTDKGLTKANGVYERHMLISKFLIETLGVSAQTADNDACRIEHVISQESFDKIKIYIKNLP